MKVFFLFLALGFSLAAVFFGGYVLGRSHEAQYQLELRRKLYNIKEK